MMTINRNLPEDIMVEILLHLPVKSLSRFLCVCKAWYALIKGNSFIQKHLHVSKEGLLVVYNEYYDANRNQRFNFLSNDFTETVNPNLSQALQDHNLVSGHCNGIFCFLKLDGEGLLWNLANREIRELPPLPPRDSTKEYIPLGLRFGWDERTNDYKVVVFSTEVYGDDENWHPWFDYVAECGVYIYSLSNDSWRHFNGIVPFYDVDDQLLKCLDGVFYWFQQDNQTGRLLSFHIGDEIFEEITGPDFLTGQPNINITLDKYNDHIAIIYGARTITVDEMSFEIWIFVENCWNKLLTIGPFTWWATSLGFGVHGEVLFRDKIKIEDRDGLLIYDPQSQEVDDPGFRGVDFQVYRYKESLVSMKRML